MRGGTTLMRVQTRGGGRGGLSDEELKLWITSADVSVGNSVRLTAEGPTTAPEKLKHLSAHPAIEPQSLVVLLSQGLPCGQQSTCAAPNAASVDMARATLPATGSMATDSAMSATRMARPMFISARSSGLAPLGSSDAIVSANTGAYWLGRQPVKIRPPCHSLRETHLSRSRTARPCQRNENGC